MTNEQINAAIATAREEAFQAQNERDEATALTRELKTELNHALAELHQARANARPEPSRLEIAAMLKAGWFAARVTDFNATEHKWWLKQADEHKWWLKQADELIAAAATTEEVL